MASAFNTTTGVAQFPTLVSLQAKLMANVAAATELLVLVVLFALLTFFVLLNSYFKGRCCKGGHQRLVDAVTTLPPLRLVTVIIAGILLTVAVFSGMPQVGFALSSAIAYVVLYSIGEDRQKKPKTSHHLKSRVAPPALAAADRHAIPASQQQSTRRMLAESSRDTLGVQATDSRFPTDSRVRSFTDGSFAQHSIEQRRGRSSTEDRVAGRRVTYPEVQEIVRSSLSTAADELVVRNLINHIRKHVIPLVPEAQITGCAAGNLMHVGSQGLKPEVDIVVMASTEVLTERLKAFYLRGSSVEKRTQKSMSTLHPEVLQKTATRVLSERMTSLRFWRSQFTGPEPKIVLLAPASLGFCQYPIRVNFSVNNPYPQRLSMVLSKGHARCKELILLVLHWASVRGITNTGRGHLHPYAYSLLVIHYLREKYEGDLTDKCVVEVFGDFARFYCELFAQSSAVVVRFGVGEEQRLSPESSLFGIPFIEDPYAPAGRDVGSSMTADGVERLRHELARALRIIDAGPTTLGDLLERWIPLKATESSELAEES